VAEGGILDLSDLTTAAASPRLPEGGETAGRRRLERWLESGIDEYAELHDKLAADATSGLSPYLHFGCLSALETAALALSHPRGEAFGRQLCWRDFYLQLLHAVPRLARADYRPRGDVWREDEDALAAWREGRTGYPVVDAGMRQLRQEGAMHNRARLIAASFLTKDLCLDWRHGVAHFSELLVDGDVASNAGNWQWVAGTGTDPRPNRIFNPTRQALRFDPQGDYVRRYVPELAGIEGGAVHEPWKLGRLKPADYPDRVIVHEAAAAAFRARRGGRALRP
jgi:deoxyribodipyrimidine photo-lyase